MSKIEWTKKTWNPIIGCRRVSAGCENCYAEIQVHRGMCEQHKGLTMLGATGKGPRWNGEFNVAASRLDETMRRQKPDVYFVNSLSDLFYERLPFPLIAGLLGIMASANHHTYQVLTKRPSIMLEFFGWLLDHELTPLAGEGAVETLLAAYARVLLKSYGIERTVQVAEQGQALAHVDLGVTGEDQSCAAERVQLLLRCPVKARNLWLSYEPALGPVDLGDLLPALDWVVVGGESGARARPFDIEWARSTVRQCKAAGVAAFVKQLGANPVVGGEPTGNFRTEGGVRQYEYVMTPLDLKSHKGDDMSEWPEDLRVREMPGA
jgi:protein gp37